MSRVLSAPVLVATLLLLLGIAGALGWIWLRSGRPDHLATADLVVMALPVAALWGAALLWGVDRQKLAITAWAVWIFAAMVPLIYTLNTTPKTAPPPVAPAASEGTRGIDQVDRLFAGALSDGTMPLAIPGLRYLRNGAFRNGGSLQFFHFDTSAAAADYQAVLARNYEAAGQPLALETGGGLNVRRDGNAMHLRRQGTDILLATAPDAAALQAWVAGWNLPPPAASSTILSNAMPPWRFALGYGLAFFAAGIGFVIWLGYWASRVSPPRGYAPVTAQALQQRLYSLNDSGLGMVVTPGETPGDVRVNWSYRNGKRATSMRLRFQPGRKRVVAKEFSKIAGDAPLTASEARMNSRTRLDSRPRPDADILYEVNWSVTIPDEKARQNLGVRVVGKAVQLPADAATRIPPTALAHLLTEIVRQSGWTWQGGFFFSQGGDDTAAEGQRAP